MVPDHRSDVILMLRREVKQEEGDRRRLRSQKGFFGEVRFGYEQCDQWVHVIEVSM